MEKREPMRLEIDGDFLHFTISNKKYEAKIIYEELYEFYLVGVDCTLTEDDLLFEEAGIEDKGQFQRETLGYSFNTVCFPSCHTRKDVIKLAKAIVDYNNGRLKGNGVLSLKKRKNIKFNFNL